MTRSHPVLITILLLASGYACAQDPNAQRSLSATGVGYAGVAPDTAIVDLGVETEATSADKALQDNSARTQRLIESLRARGVAEKEIQTRSLSLQPQYVHNRSPNPGGQTTRELVGYRATNLISVRLSDMAVVGEVIDAAVKAGGNRIDHIRFEVSDPSAMQAVAREAAFEDAKAKAEQLAALADTQLGEVLTIQSHDINSGPVREVSLARSMAMDSVPVQGGQITKSVSVQVTWALR